MTVKHGVGVADLKIDDTGMLTCTLTDGTIIDVGQLPTGEGNCCDPDSCTCITSMMATDADVDPLLTAIGLYDMTAAQLLDE